jgi:hypothetical protein
MADESQPLEERAPKRKAKDNPWYRLATLHGQSSHRDHEIAAKNRNLEPLDGYRVTRRPQDHPACEGVDGRRADTFLR